MDDLKHQISAQANYLKGVLDNYAKDSGGACQIVFNMTDMWDQAYQSSQKLGIYLMWIGDSPWGSNANTAALLGRVAREWRVGVRRGRGLTSPRGKTLTEETSVCPFYDAVEDVRDIIRTQIGVSEFAGMDNLKTVEWDLKNKNMTGKLITFFTKNDLPGVVTK